MTNKSAPDQGQQLHKVRAVWLARLPAGKRTDEPLHLHRKEAARALAAESGVAIVGEFLCSSAFDSHPSDHVWAEVISLLEHCNAGVLIVLDPGELAGSATEFHDRTVQLDHNQIELVVPEADDAWAARRIRDSEVRAA